MSQTYQLSKSGIERLERFKRDVLAGDFEVREEHLDDGTFLCFIIENAESVACCFMPNKNDIADDIERQLDRTIKGKIEKNKIGYFVAGGFALMKSDVELKTKLNLN